MTMAKAKKTTRADFPKVLFVSVNNVPGCGPMLLAGETFDEHASLHGTSLVAEYGIVNVHQVINETRIVETPRKRRA